MPGRGYAPGMDCTFKLVIVPVTDADIWHRRASAGRCRRSDSQIVSESAGQEAGR
jgi:hypothetical protein